MKIILIFGIMKDILKDRANASKYEQFVRMNHMQIGGANQDHISFDKISRNVLGFSFILGIFIMFIAVFFVSNTILLIVYSKKYEIKTLQLLGASKSFIKLPYIFEGIIFIFSFN